MKNEQRKLWFKAKIYGWGWYPSTWQGFLTLVVWILLLVKIFSIVDQNSHSVSDTLIAMVIPFLLMAILLMLIGYGAGEKPRWRWGR